MREGAGRNNRWKQDNAEAEGFDRPSQVDARIQPDGSNLPASDPDQLEPADPDEADAAFINLFLNAL